MRTLTLLALAAAMLATGCRSTQPETAVKPTYSVSTDMAVTTGSVDLSIDTIEKDVSEIKEEASVIQVEAAKIIGSKSEEPVIQSAEVIRDSSTKIEYKAQDAAEEVARLRADNQRLRGMGDSVAALQTRIASLEDSISVLRADALKRLYAYVTVFWIIGFVLITAAAVLFFVFKKAEGVALGLVGVTIIGFASAAHYYLEQIALVGAFVLVGAFLVAIFMIGTTAYKAKANGIAVAEIVEMVQILKETMTKGERERIFGKNGVADRMQSDITKAVVQRILEKEKTPEKPSK
jgi:hypothetical protein